MSNFQGGRMKNRLAIVVVGALVIIVGIIFAVIFLGGLFRSNGVGVKANTDEPPKLVLRDFRQLRGTKYFVAEISTSYDAPYIEYSSSSRWFEFGESGGQIRNLVFLDSDTLLSHKLFSTNQPLIVRLASFPEQPAKLNADDPEPEIIPIQWFVYEVVHQDTNQDGALNQDDLRTIGFSDADGKRYIELLSDVSAIHDMSFLEEGKLLIAYQQKNDRFASKINLTEQSMVTEMLPDLGTEVE
jgi:hypothetical protein